MKVSMNMFKLGKCFVPEYSDCPSNIIKPKIDLVISAKYAESYIEICMKFTKNKDLDYSLEMC